MKFIQENLLWIDEVEDYIEIAIDGAHLEGGLHLNIEIYDVLGEKVVSVKTHGRVSLQRIDISQLPRGLYFIRVGGRVEKFVKK